MSMQLDELVAKYGTHKAAANALGLTTSQFRWRYVPGYRTSWKNKKEIQRNWLRKKKLEDFRFRGIVSMRTRRDKALKRMHARHAQGVGDTDVVRAAGIDSVLDSTIKNLNMEVI